jgi:hypothetical protein
MKRFFIACCVLALAAFAAHADVPDPSKCVTTLDSVQRVYMCPDGLGDCPAASFTVTIRNASNVGIANAVTEVLIGGQGTNHTRICPNQVLTTNTNASGVATFNIGGGGCLKAAAAAVIRSNGVEIRSFDAVMGSDYAASDNAGIPGRSDLLVSPVDLSSFVAAYQGGVGPASCHDYSNNGTTGPEDLGVFTAAYKGGTNRCP